MHSTAQGIWRTDLLKQAWAAFKVSIAAAFHRSRAVYRASLELAAGTVLALGVLLGNTLGWLALIALMPHGHALAAYANATVTPQEVANEALRLLINNTVMTKYVNRQYDKEWEGKDYKIGDSVTIKDVPRYEVKTGAPLQVQDRKQNSLTLTLDSQAGVHTRFTSKELTLDLEAYSEAADLESKMSEIAAHIDDDMFSLYKDVYNCVGTPGTTPSTLANGPLLVKRRMFDEAVPSGNRYLVFNGAAEAAFLNSFTPNFNQPESREIQNEGTLQRLAGFSLAAAQGINLHTVGTWDTGSTGVLNGNVSTGATSIVTDGWANSTAILKQGDVFTIAAVYSVNPKTRRSTGVLKQFVATADVTSSGAGAATITVNQAIYGPENVQQQTVSALPLDGAAITVVGTEATQYTQNLAFHRDAFTIAFAPLILPPNVMAARASAFGFSVRTLWQYDKDSDTMVHRIDVLYGKKTLDPRLAVRLVGEAVA